METHFNCDWCGKCIIFDSALADIIFVATSATGGRVIYFVKCVNFSVNNPNFNSNIHKLTHTAKFLRKV